MRHPVAGPLRTMRAMSRSACVLAVSTAALLSGSGARAQCLEQGPFQYATGLNSVVCPCFIAGEQAGTVFELPASEYPIEITRVGIKWGSQFGGAPQSFEEAIHVYAGGLPNPGAPIFTLLGPVMTDGVINEFNLDPIPGEIRIESGKFTVTLEFLNDNAGNIFAPSVTHDGNGCQPGKNVVLASPGGWADACGLGVTGDWFFYVKYRSLRVTAEASPGQVLFSNIPVNVTTCDTVFVTNTGCDTLSIAGIQGCGAAPFSVDTTMTAHTVPPGGQTGVVVCATPTSAAQENCSITIVSNASDSPTVIDVSIDGVTAVIGATPGSGFEITGVVPNPFNPETSIRFVLPEAMPVTAEVWSVSGARIRTLARGTVFPGGENAVGWDGRNGAGQVVASGVYLVRIATPIGRRVTRAVLLE